METQEKKQYSISYDQCKELIGDKVCPGCGGLLTPFETVDNANNPTFWAGCSSCDSFSWGVTKEVHAIARVLVLNRNYVHYTHLGSKYNLEDAELNLWNTQQIRGTCGIVWDVLKINEGLKDMPLPALPKED